MSNEISGSGSQYTETGIGVFPCDWRVARLSDIAEKLTQTAGTDSYETVSISAGIGFVNQAEKFGKELSGKQYKKYIVLHKGDFSYNKGNSNKYPQGCIYRLKDRETAAVPNVFESFRIQDECAEFYDHLFVSGFLNRQLSKKINHGVRDDGLLNLTEKDFYSCLLPVPPLAEQKKISGLLDHYDKIIKLCEAKLEEYKSLKKTCLSEMFPQNGNTAPEIRFPGFMGDWKQRKLGELGSFKNGMNFTKDEMDKGYPFVNLQNIFGRNVIDINNLGLAEATESQLKEYDLQKGDVLFVRSLVKLEGVGEAALVPQSLDNTTYSGFVIRFRDEAGIDNNFKRFVFGTKSVRNQIMAKATNSANKNISQDVLSDLKIFLPSKIEQQQLGKYFSYLDTLITLHQREVEEYTRLKKAMTQLLMTGIVRVKT